jgi:hypothetical protein
MNTLATTTIAPEDLLDAVRTIPLGEVATCDWLSHWVPATVLLQWADRGLAEGDGYGLSNAVTYAKRAAACRIDLLLRYNHLLPFARSAFPAKVSALRQVGIGIPDVVHELVIDPRNALEHNYDIPSQQLLAMLLASLSSLSARPMPSASGHQSSPWHGTSWEARRSPPTVSSSTFAGSVTGRCSLSTCSRNGGRSVLAPALRR